MNRRNNPSLVLLAVFPALAVLFALAPGVTRAQAPLVVERMTLYRDALRVEHHVEFGDSAGRFERIVEGLPESLRPDWVTVAGSQGIERLALDWLQDEEKPAVSGELRALDEALADLAHERDGLERQLAWLDRAVPAAGNDGLAAPASVAETGAFVLAQHARIAEALARVDRESLARERERIDLVARQVEARQHAMRPRLRLTGHRDDEVPGRVTLAWESPASDWDAHYDLQVGDAPDNARLALSARIGPTGLPGLRVRRLAVVPRSIRDGAQPDRAGALGVHLARTVEGAPTSGDSLEVAAVDGRVTPEQLNARTLPPGLSPLTADGEVHLPPGTRTTRIRLFERAATARQRLVLTPDTSTVGHEELALRNDTGFDLVAGPMTVSRPGRASTRVRLPAIGPGASVTLPIGTDSRFRAERTLLARKETDDGAHRRIDLTFRVTLHNHTNATREVFLRVRHPVGNEEHPVEASHVRPRGGNHDAEAGWVEWRMELAPGAGEHAAVFEYSYRLRVDRNFRLIPARSSPGARAASRG